MAKTQNSESNKKNKSGYDPNTKTYKSLRPKVELPPQSRPLSLPEFTLSLLNHPSTPTSATLSTTPVLIDAASGHRITYSQFLAQVRSLSSSLSPLLRRGQTAFILSPNSFLLPPLFFSLMSLGVVLSPANPLATDLEVSHQIAIASPHLAFATSATAGKLPPGLKTVILDSLEFLSMLGGGGGGGGGGEAAEAVSQSDVAAVLFSSGTTGRVKGVALTHRNLIAVIQGYHALRREEEAAREVVHGVSLFFLPMFHVFGFFMLVRAVALGETVVVMEKFDFGGMLAAVERYGVTYMPAAPPLVVALVKSEITKKYDLSSLMFIGSGGAPLGKEVVEKFREKFPNVEISQGYGMTETAGSATRMVEADEINNLASVGKLAENMEAKIVDPVSGEALPPGQKGELWVRGPNVMEGYVGDEEATAEIFDSEGWLKTGDICMFDSEGFLYVVDRLKELIKYKAYQVPPAELEHLLLSHPDIADAAVIPYPDEDAGQIPMAYVVRKPESNLSEAQVMDFVAKKVSPYKKVRRVAFINAIPKSQAGKILRRELINHALSGGKSKL